MVRQKRRKVMLALVCILGFLLLFIIGQLLFVKFNGENVVAPTIERQQEFGTGKQLSYVVLGDSTAVAQGAAYKNGVAVGSARHLATKGYRVTMYNYGVSGARVHDVLTKQLPQITEKPDVVLLSISANDVTHFSKISSVEHDMKAIVEGLRTVNPGAKIIITGTPAMGSIPRFPQPLRALAGVQTSTQNNMFKRLAKEERVTLAPIAEKLGPTFAKNPRLFAKDKFHPNNAGYALWTPVITDAMDTVL
jgi:lysophospholipase L1-like esterase